MFEKRKLNRQKILFETKRMEIALQQLEDVGRLMERVSVKDPDEDQWSRIGSGLKEFSEGDWGIMRKQAYKFWFENPHAHGLIECMIHFIIGQRINVNAQDENPKVQEWWDEFEKKNKFSHKQKEIVRRTLRDGECFIRYFVNMKEGTTKIRFIEPSEIADPENIHSHGIETDPDDIETPINYIRSKGGKRLEIIPAEEIQHIKILADSNVKRGTSILYPAMPMIKKYEEWLNDRIVLNKVRNCVALVISSEGAAPSQIDSLVSQRATSTGETGKVKAFKPGTIVRLGGGMKYDMVAPNIQAADVQHDGRAILLAIAVATQTAEYMASGDASNANYSSTMVAESPPVKMFEYWQSFFEESFQEMFRRVTEAGITYGDIPTTSKKTIKYASFDKEHSSEEIIPTIIECEIGFGGLITRNIKEETEAILAQKNAGLISGEKAAEKLGHDYHEEQEKIKYEEMANEETRGNLFQAMMTKEEPEKK